MLINEAPWDKLSAVATEAAAHAYAPYSRLSVGAAVLTVDGQIFAGCNVENASYGLTICAERCAIFSAVAGSKSRPELAVVFIVTDPEVPGSPCGACRQVLAEFGPEALVSFVGSEGRMRASVAELLPNRFAPETVLSSRS